MFRFNYLQRIRIRPEVLHTVSKGEITLQTNDTRKTAKTQYIDDLEIYIKNKIYLIEPSELSLYF